MRTPNRDHNGRFKRGISGNPNGRTPGSKNREKRLPIDDTVLAVELERRGLTTMKIADALNATPEAVKEALAGARRLLQVYAPQFAQHLLTASRVAAENGDHKAALAALQSVKAVEPIAQVYDNGQGSKATAAVQVQFVGFGFAGLPPQPAQSPAITVASTTDE